MQELNLGVTEFDNINQNIALYQLSPKDIERVQSFSPHASQQLKTFLDDFYNWIPEVPEFSTLFARPGLIEKVKVLQTTYWKQFFECQIDRDYIETRFKVGNVHARVHLPISSYIAAVNFSNNWWIDHIRQIDLSSTDKLELTSAISKQMMLDIAIVSAAYSKSSNDLIEQQNRTLMELSTPTIQLWDDILVLPIVGILDSKRAEDMAENMLGKVMDTQAKAVIIDIMGVPTVDSSVANHLIKITKATKLMGCECILSGIGPVIAQTLVQLGVELELIQTTASLKDALELALNKTGYAIKEKAAGSHHGHHTNGTSSSRAHDGQ